MDRMTMNYVLLLYTQFWGSHQLEYKQKGKLKKKLLLKKGCSKGLQKFSYDRNKQKTKFKGESLLKIEAGRAAKFSFQHKLR